MVALEEMVKPDSWARVVDMVVDTLPMEEYGFKHSQLKREGNLPYHPSDMLKLYLYGYRHGYRSANQLARQCEVNIEVKWLIKELTPSARKINYFRANNAKAIERAMKGMVRLLQDIELIKGKVIAQDGTKVRGQNNKRRYFTAKKVKKHLRYIEERLEEYCTELQQIAQQQEALEEGKPMDKAHELEQKVETLKERQADYQKIEQQLTDTGADHISLTDPDCAQLKSSNGGWNIGHNVQMVTDDEHQLIVEIYVGECNDSGELSTGCARAKETLGVDELDCLADGGYYTGSQIAACEQMGVQTYVSPVEHSHRRTDGFSKKDFVYVPEENHVICPQGHVLETNGRIYDKNDRDPVYQYKTDACYQCPFAKQCCDKHKKQRIIEQSIYESEKLSNNKRVKANPDYYKRRKMIVEHPFGTLKRYWGMDYTLLRGKEKVATEFRVAAIAYNILRAVSILGYNELEKGLKKSQKSTKNGILWFFDLLRLIKYTIANMVKNGLVALQEVDCKTKERIYSM
jgi:transposase